MKDQLSKLLEDAIINYEHSQIGQQYLVNLVKLTKRWKLISVGESKKIFSAFLCMGLLAGESAINDRYLGL